MAISRGKCTAYRGPSPCDSCSIQMGLVPPRSLQTQGAPRAGQPWALLSNAFSVSKSLAGGLLQHNAIQGRKDSPQGNAPVLITVKRLNNKAQGRRQGGAPWVQRQKVQGTPTGSDNTDGHIPRTMSRISRPHPVLRMFNPNGIGVITFVANPGRAACRSTLGFVVKRLQRKQTSGRRPAATQYDTRTKG